ncbi:DUF2330 domain-containing protein, partial [Actinomadura adrarensis]
FRVATLDAEEPGALAGWLRANGYRLSPELEKELGPYVRQGWKYVAVKLRPKLEDTLDGELAPLLVQFRSDELVYPMRLSRLAKNPQSLHLYVLSENRVKQTTGGRMEVTFAGHVTRGQLDGAGLRAFVGDRLFLTELVDRHIDPGSIEDDYRFAATDNVPYQQVVHRTEIVRFLGMPAGWLIVFGGTGLVLIGAGALVVSR